jgi:hypothetical protein
MTEVSLGGGNKKASATPEQQKQKMIYLDIPTAIVMIIELGDSKNIKKFSDPIIANIKQSLTNKEIRKILCTMFGVKTARKFKKLKPQEFEIVTAIFGDVWGLK